MKALHFLDLEERYLPNIRKLSSEIHHQVTCSLLIMIRNQKGHYETKTPYIRLENKNYL